MTASEYFALAVFATMLCAWWSGDHVRQKLALLLMLDWAATNLAVNYLGFERAPLVMPSLDAFVAILVVLVGYAHKSRVSLVVFGIYGLVGLAHVAAFIFRTQGTYNYYATLNAEFASQLIVVGGSGAWMAFHRWTDWSRERLHPYSARR